MAKNSMSPRRWAGGTFLAIAALMVVLGFTVFAERLKGLAFIYYWLTCFAFTLSAATAALVDLVMLRREAIRQQRTLIEEALDESKDNGIRDRNKKRQD